MASPTTAPSDTEWARKYPPLVAILVALAIVIAVLPSALNLPQTNPTQTLEYAPVPPDDSDEPPPPEGNLTNLGLGTSPAIEGPGDPTGGTIPPVVGKGKTPSSKRCVGNPPRQTEDPIAPPCVAFFQGDNFGATYQGVTEDEVRLLIYIDGNFNDVGSSKGSESRPQEEYFDLFKPPKAGEEEHIMVRKYRGWQRYFNERFQTYGRTVHFFLYFSGVSKDPETRRADAAGNYGTVKPFAVLTVAQENEVDYVDAMAKKGVLNFGSFNGKARDFFKRFPKLIWGYQPSLEQMAAQYASYVCTKVVNEPVVVSGNPADNGKPRKLGFMSTSDESYPGYILLAELVRKKVEDCGGKIAADATFPKCCFVQDNNTRPDYAAQNMARFQQEGITTVLWAGGVEGNSPRAAEVIGYRPEWILLGDATWAGQDPVRLSGAGGAFDERAVMVTPYTLQPAPEQSRCYQAYREVDKTMVAADVSYDCGTYRNLFQLFTGIQVAGPRLGPTSVDRGFHAIPALSSNDPQTPSCYYETDDYTCVKDATVEMWDGQGQPPGDNLPGCWRAFEGGKRYLPGSWPKGNVNAQMAAERPCNGASGGWTIDPA